MPDPTFSVIDVIEHDDGTLNVQLEVSEEFKEWFQDLKGIDEWDDDKFSEWFCGILRAYLDET
jgi:hypothetical protein